MIKKITPDTPEDVIKRIVYIHKQCVKKSNSTHYPTDIINEWLAQITTENTKSQLDTSTWVVIEDENKIIGFAQYEVGKEVIYQMQIIPHKQRRGHGRQLYEHIEKEFKKNKKGRIWLYSTLNAVDFYKNLGFEEIKTIYLPLEKTQSEMRHMEKNLH